MAATRSDLGGGGGGRRGGEESRTDAIQQRHHKCCTLKERKVKERAHILKHFMIGLLTVLATLKEENPCPYV